MAKNGSNLVDLTLAIAAGLAISSPHAAAALAAEALAQAIWSSALFMKAKAKTILLLMLDHACID